MRQPLQFAQFLPGEGHAALERLRQFVLGVQVHRHVQQRTRRRDPQFAAAAAQAAQQGECGIEVVAPDVAPVDDPGRQHLVRAQALGHPGGFAQAAHQVHVQAGNRQPASQVEVVFQRAEVSGHQQLEACCALLRAKGAGKLGIGGAHGVLPVGGQVEGQNGLVQLHPCGARGIQGTQDPHVGVKQRRQEREAVESLGAALAQPQPGQRAGQHRLGGQALFARQCQLVQQILRVGREAGGGVELGHEVVVVGVEPLGEFQRRLAGRAARQREMPRPARLPRLEAETGRGRAQAQSHRGDVVVGREIASCHHVQPGPALVIPLLQAQGAPGAGEFGLAALAGPERLERELPLPFRADAGVTQGMRANHVYSSNESTTRIMVHA
ncbi:hypothetical protein GALL_416210 [mine drainage metagenome]|uniref:Uncharacterized protein n=1 Tax=mine drainage metagenome TaxID=410659 RepID=A0A1J5Q0A4_9ZZZZ